MSGNNNFNFPELKIENYDDYDENKLNLNKCAEIFFNKQKLQIFCEFCTFITNNLFDFSKHLLENHNYLYFDQQQQSHQQLGNSSLENLNHFSFETTAAPDINNSSRRPILEHSNFSDDDNNNDDDDDDDDDNDDDDDDNRLESTTEELLEVEPDKSDNEICVPKSSKLKRKNFKFPKLTKIKAESSDDDKPLSSRDDFNCPYNESDAINKIGKKNNETILNQGKPKKLQKRYKKPKKEPGEKLEWKCHICGFSCPRGTNRLEHLKLHAGMKIYTCEQCGKSYSTRATLEYHLRGHTGEFPFNCEFCQKRYKDADSLKRHQNTNHFRVPIKQFQCEVCNNFYTTMKILKTHVKKMHEQPRPERIYSCDLCRKKFCDEATMHKHRDNHKYEDKPFKCSDCPKTFDTKYGLKTHTRINHLKDYNYQCAYCDRGFIKLRIKRIHEMTHTRREEDKISCQYCDVKFTVKGSLRTHIKRFHSGSLKYDCRKCGDKFDLKFEYVEHCKSHLSEIENEKFPCSDCNLRFTKAHSLKTHWEEQHSSISRKEDQKPLISDILLLIIQ